MEPSPSPPLERRESSGRRLFYDVVLIIIGLAAGAVSTWLYDNWEEVRQTVWPDRRTPLSAGDAYAAMTADLDRTDPEDRPARRYLTLTHVHNDPDLSNKQVRAVRDRLYALAGWLSPQNQTALFRPVDEAQTVFAVDLDDLGWSADADWKRVAAEYPYALGHDAEGDGSPEGYEAVKEATGSSVPAVRGDWFLAAVCRPPLGGASPTVKLQDSEAPSEVLAAARDYPMQTLDLAAAARDLGVGSTDDLAKALRADDKWQTTFGMDDLLEGRAIRRELWESRRFNSSPYQRLAAELGLGSPVIVVP